MKIGDVRVLAASIELDAHELRAIWKLIGETSREQRREVFKLNAEENSAASKLYNQLDDFLRVYGEIE